MHHVYSYTSLLANAANSQPPHLYSYMAAAATAHTEVI